MSEKHLSESAWKSLVSKQGVSDPGLQKALAALAKAESGGDASKGLSALEDIAAFAAKIRKASAGNKEVVGYLDDLLKAAAKKKSELSSAPKEEESGEEGDEEEKGSPGEILKKALLKVKTAGGEASHAAMICLAKPLCGLAVALTPTKALGQKHKAALKDATGGTRFLEARCIWESSAFTFILDQVPGGLAKKLKAVLVQQAGLTQKVRIRNLDGSVVSDDETDVEAPEDGTGGDDLAAFKQRVATLKPAAAKAIEAKAPHAEDIRKALTEAVKQAEKGSFATANKFLDAVERLAVVPPSSTGDKKAPLDDRNQHGKAPHDERHDPVPPPPPTTTGGTPPPPPPPTTGSTPPPPPTPDPVAEFLKNEVKPVRALLEQLRKHAQAAHAQGEITTADTKIGEAETKAATDIPAARLLLAEARTALTTGKDAADKFALYSAKRVEADDLVRAMDGMWSDDTKHAAFATLLSEADALAAPDQRQFPQADAKLDDILTRMPAQLKEWEVDDPKAEITTLKSHAAATFIDPLIKAAETAVGESLTMLNAGNYRGVILNSRKLGKLILDAKKAADRRLAFDQARAPAALAVENAKPFAELSGRRDALVKRLAAADTEAGLDVRHFEIATEEVKKIQADAEALVQAGPDAKEYTKEREAIGKQLDLLAKHASAALVKPALDGVRAQIQRADKLAPELATVKQAREILGQANLDLASADKALQLAAANKTTLDGAGDAEGVKKAVAALRKQAVDAAKDANSDDLKKQLADVEKALEKAEKAGEKNKPKDAAKPLAEAAALLAKITDALGQLASYKAQVDGLERRLAVVLTSPAADAIKAKTKIVRDALDKAAKQAKDLAWGKQAPLLATAEDALAEAERLAKARVEYDTRVTALKKRLKDDALDKKVEKVIQAALDDAEKKAKSFDFAGATAAHNRAESLLESAAIEAEAAKTPPDAAKIETAVKNMMKNGGAKQVDELIAKLPDTTPYEVLPVLAKERFGIELKTDASDETRSGKRLLKMLAMVPADVVGNPSLKTVERRDPDEDGGFYRSSEDLVVMNGRPEQETQGFGKNIANELPRNVDKDCRPANDKPEDYFDFSTLHEVGHSVDDNLNFMGARAGKAEFGGWQSHGGNLGPIAEKVAAWAKYDSTPEQKKAVLDLVMGRQVAWPTPPSGKETEWAKARKKAQDWYDTATDGDVWNSQSGSEFITLDDGRIYHEAYSKSWVSYLASARSQGITGYQFRAPGEWFAELYAAYRIGKLKKSHPAVKWLSTIKV